VADLVRRRSAALATLPVARELIEEAARNARRSLSEATQRAYAADWRRFEGWCDAHGLPSLPADEATIITYLTAAARGYALDEGVALPPLGYGSLARLYSAVRVMHDETGNTLPKLRGVTNALHTLGRTLGVAPKNPKRALTREQIKEAVALLTTTPADTRARAVLLFGWIIGQRRSDIAALQLRDVTFEEQGATVRLRKSKTDQLGRGRTIAVTRRGGRFCAVAALEAWLGYRKPSEPRASLLGVSAVTVNQIVKRAAASIGLDPRKYGGHSLRRGFVTSAARAGSDVAAIMKVTGHESVEQVLEYIEEATPFQRDIGSALLSDGEGEDTLRKPLREYVPPTEDKSLKATIGELAGPLLTKMPVAATTPEGQPLVDRRAAQEMRRRVVVKPDFTRDGAPCDVAWLVKQSQRMADNGRSVGAIVAALNAIKVRHGDGKELTSADVKRWLASD
jgi:integrase